MTLVPYLSRGQSNKSNWRHSTQITLARGEPAWNDEPPTGLVVSIAIVDRRGSPCIVAKSSDGTEFVTLCRGGYVVIALPAGNMSALSAGLYDVHVQTDKGNDRSQFVLGRLPIVEGVSI